MTDDLTNIHSDCWRSDGERVELVERIIRLDAESRLLRKALREQAGDDASLVAVLLARIEGLEKNLDRMSRRKGRAA